MSRLTSAVIGLAALAVTLLPMIASSGRDDVREIRLVRPGMTGPRQVAFRLDYSGGWRTYRKTLSRGFVNSCRRYSGPPLAWLVTACTMPDGSHWAVQSWQRGLPNLGLDPVGAVFGSDVDSDLVYRAIEKLMADHDRNVPAGAMAALMQAVDDYIPTPVRAVDLDEQPVRRRRPRRRRRCGCPVRLRRGQDRAARSSARSAASTRRYPAPVREGSHGRSPRFSSPVSAASYCSPRRWPIRSRNG